MKIEPEEAHAIASFLAGRVALSGKEPVPRWIERTDPPYGYKVLTTWILLLTTAELVSFVLGRPTARRHRGSLDA